MAPSLVGADHPPTGTRSRTFTLLFQVGGLVGKGGGGGGSRGKKGKRLCLCARELLVVPTLDRAFRVQERRPEPQRGLVL
jgi:hypothetical protein